SADPIGTTAKPTGCAGPDSNAIRTAHAKYRSCCDAAGTIVNTARRTTARTARATASASAGRRAGDYPADTAAGKTASTRTGGNAIRTAHAKCRSCCDAAGTIVNTAWTTTARTVRSTSFLEVLSHAHA